MKRYFLILTALALLFTTTACGAGDLGSPEYMAEKQHENELQNSTVEEEPLWSANFEGLLECFEWHGYVQEDTKTETLANIIGASEGYRYKSQVGRSQFYVELYYFDPEKLNETSNNIISEILETGSFHMLETEVPATLSSNKKYMMVYNDQSSDEFNLNTKQEAIDTVVNFD